MAIVVNKEEKRRAIALSCRELLLDRGIDKLTISELARTAEVGKGTIYEYFDNKEDMVFEIITTFMVEYEERLLGIIGGSDSAREKINQFFTLIFEDPVYHKQLNLYQEFLAISLTGGTAEMIEFGTLHRQRFADILGRVIDEAVSRGEISAKAKELVPALIIFGKGLIVDAKVTSIDAKKEVSRFLDTLFALIETKDQ